MRIRLLVCLLVLAIPSYAVAQNYEKQECAKLRPAIESQIETANYCKEDSDCARAKTACPFGCNIYVNKNEVEKINKRIKAYRERCGECEYKCLMYIEPFACIDGKCKRDVMNKEIK